MMGDTCATCGQVDIGQTGEYPCLMCGLPTLHDEPIEGAPALVPWKWGIEIWRDALMTTYFYKRWRFIWYNPRDRENWKLDAIFNEGVFQIGLGPAVFVYVRSEDF